MKRKIKMSASKKMSSPPVITLESITPALAAEWLKGNNVNRRLVANHVERLASEMLAGEWRVTGDTIKLNGDRLLDGQHRLQAIVRSGVTVQCFVARNVELEAFPVLDTGRIRAGGDVLSAHGYRNVYITASVCRLVWMFERKIGGLNATVTNSAILNLVRRHPELIGFISDVSAFGFAKTSGIVSSLYWLWATDNAKGEEFLAQFLRGAELKITNPIYPLRERVINDHMLRATKSGRRALIAMVFRVWEAWLSGKSQTSLKATRPTGEEFPWPSGAPYLVD
jgi:drug/metabolite transporter superfamily protein YnfA